MNAGFPLRFHNKAVTRGVLSLYSRHIISLRHVCFYQSTQTDVIDLTDFQKNDVLVDFSVIVGNHNNLG